MPTTSYKILIVEDTLAMAILYEKQLASAGYIVETASSLSEANEKQSTTQFDLLLLDLNLPDGDGLEYLERIFGTDLETSAIVITADASLNKAIQAMKLGALDYLVKPFAESRLITTVANTLERIQLRDDLEEIRAVTHDNRHFQDFIGSSKEMQKVYRTIENVAKSKATVFVLGNSGTGKEVCAEAIHKTGPRSGKPFIAVNCAAIPKDLLESELFGHLKGSFTGAISNRLGAAKEANGGTLFLDELCELDLNLQSKLLRFLQTSEVTAVGTSKSEKVDVRVICATNKDPIKEVREGRFREDLFFRLNVVPIKLPDLQLRGRDIIEIAEYFLKKYSLEEGKKFLGFTKEASVFLNSYSWPGNVRELQNTIRNIAVLHNDELVTPEMFPEMSTGVISTSNAAVPHSNQEDESGRLKRLSDIEREAIEERIKLCDGSIPLAAETLGVSPSTLYRKKEDWKANASKS
ncbi:sigma-54 dependent transcriptional regulator [Temperatibacter marinus]|uniref:Sigma-54 dependent transcriptional regulator n=1 Tax=Temperatibacter marinus TaxID=1456591 RepID=A0AA52EGK9_9PROT|nr:sigma-54 dependent transcriptional regulator [Temperatibacter marinus]WND03283.1 sigma-54 dependent transcriptional regulator [Temperatibacter marinus]